MSSFWNNRITISIFGESHGPAIGVIIDNLPPGEYIDVEELGRFMARRAPKKDGTTTSRSERDLPQIMSGVFNDRTTGTPLCAFRIPILIRVTIQTFQDLHAPVMRTIRELSATRASMTCVEEVTSQADLPLLSALQVQYAHRYSNAVASTPVRT